MIAKSITVWLIVAGVLIYVSWDFVAYFWGGGDATESVTVGTWMMRSLWVTFAVALLIGHLAGSGPNPFNWKHSLTLALGLIAGYALTRF